MSIVPTFYVDFSSGRWEVTCVNSDTCQNILLGKSYDKRLAIIAARKYYFGSLRKDDKFKIVNVTE